MSKESFFAIEKRQLKLNKLVMPKTILIVEDHSFMRYFIAEILINAGYRVIEAEDGHDALSKLDGCLIDLIFTDLNMPKMGGLDLIKTVRQRSDCRLIPVVVYSADRDHAKKHADSALNVKAWLNKSTMRDRIIFEVSTLLR